MGDYLKDNWFFVVVAVYLISMILYGHYRGFVRLSISAVSLILSLGVVHFGSPVVANMLRNNEAIYQAVENGVNKFLQGDDVDYERIGNMGTYVVEEDDTITPAMQRSIIEEMGLPSQLKDALLENNNSEVYKTLGVNSFTHYVSRYLANSMINIFSFFILFTIVFGGLRILSVSLNLVAKLPIISGINRLAGAALGGVEAVFFIWISGLLITMFSTTSLGQIFVRQIEGNICLTWLYGHNILGELLLGVVKRII